MFGRLAFAYAPDPHCVRMCLTSCTTYDAQQSHFLPVDRIRVNRQPLGNSDRVGNLDTESLKERESGKGHGVGKSRPRNLQGVLSGTMDRVMAGFALPGVSLE